MSRACIRCSKPRSHRLGAGLCWDCYLDRCKRHKAHLHAGLQAKLRAGMSIDEAARHNGISTNRAYDILRDPAARVEKPRPTVRIRQIVVAAATLSGLTVNEILGTRKPAHIIRVRHAVYHTAHKLGHAYAQVARFLGKDHTTIINGVRKCEILMERDADYAALVEQIAAHAPSVEWGTVVPFQAVEMPAPEPEPEPETAASEDAADLDDMDALSVAVAAHYRRARA